MALLATYLLFVSSLLAAVEPSSLTGDWVGTLAAGGAQLRLVVHLGQDVGHWRGTMDSVDQSATGIPIDSVAVVGSELRFYLPGINGRFSGTVSDDGSEVDGQWVQNGVTLPLKLTRPKGDIPKLSRPQEPKPPFPYDAVDVTYSNETAHVSLAGTLTVPRTPGHHPAVLLITGSGPQDRDEALMGHKPFLVLADYLTRHGIVVLRADDRGVGKSTGHFATATTADFASDARAGVAFLKTRPEVDPAQIGLVGHSEGGIIAPMVAAGSRDVAFVVLMAGVGVNMEDLLRRQSRLILKSAGLDDTFIELNDRTIARGFDIVRAEPDSAAAAVKLRALAADMLAGMTESQKAAAGATLETLEASISAINTPWFRFLLQYDPAATLRKVRQPVLALDGSLDLQVPPSQNLPAIEKALHEGGNTHVDTVELPGLNHLFQTATTGSPAEYARIEETIASAALERITNWILKETGGASNGKHPLR